MEAQKRFSIVIPVYNAEKYLKQAIDSVINQTLDFKKNVELILINDGSKDGSAAICENYQKQYPDNVVYINQENAGVSVARNKGVEAATGQYIGFLDADDKFSRKTLAQVAAYFRIAVDAADVAIIPVTNFGAKNFPYYLNGKFQYGSRTLDLTEPSWNYVCMRVGQAFIRCEAAKAEAFDSSVTFFEDSKYINQIARKKMRMGLVTGCEYFYRRYPAEADAATSLTVGAETNKRLYLETPVKVPLYFLEEYENDEDAPLYFQYLALCEMRWRMFYTQKRTRDFLSVEEFKEYEAINDRILKRISDKAIMSFSQYAPWQKLYLLNRKHKTDILKQTVIDENKRLMWKDYVFCDLNKAGVLLLDTDIDGASVVIKGYVNSLLNNQVTLFARSSGKKYYAKPCKEKISPSQILLDYDCYEYGTFSVKIPITSEPTRVIFGMEVNGEDLFIRSVGSSQRGNVEHVKATKQMRSGYLLIRTKNSLEISKATTVRIMRSRFNDLFGKAKSYAKKTLSAAKKGPRFFLRKVKAKLFK